MYYTSSYKFVFFFSVRRRHTRLQGDWSSDVCSSDLSGRARPFRSACVRASVGGTRERTLHASRTTRATGIHRVRRRRPHPARPMSQPTFAPLPPVAPDGPVSLDALPTTPPRGIPVGKELAAATRARLERLEELQAALHAEGRRSLLVVLQARDAGGKDGTIRRVFGAFRPQGLRVTSFRAPVGDELAHDFLWRVHRRAPAHGMIGVFNRSHYEDVLAVRVRGLASEEVWRGRYEHINAFERLLADSGTRVVKLFLHVSRDEQARRLRDRLQDSGKNWKFDPGDLEDRARW